MLQQVGVGKQSIDAYAGIVGRDKIDELRSLAAPLKGLRVVHINATPYGGGVSEILRSLVPLENSLGIDSEWRIIFGDQEFYQVTKTVHDAIQGEEHHLTALEKETYLKYNYINAREFRPDLYDIVFIHDPQPAAMLQCTGGNNAKWVWRCHIDSSQPNPEVWDYLRNFLPGYDRAVFTLPEFVPPRFPVEVAVIQPAIDPLSPKNMELSADLASEVLSWLGMYPGQPFVTQVSRFDKWKDPFGVIEAYRIAKGARPDLHLALVGSMAFDDPTSWELYAKLGEEDRKDPDLHVFTNLTGVSSVEVNAFQRLAKVVIQKSIREGFGLVVSEALWKETPVVAGNAGGIPAQLDEGGFLVESAEECARRIVHLLDNEEEARALGTSGRQHVLRNFLITRLMRDHLELLASLM